MLDFAFCWKRFFKFFICFSFVFVLIWPKNFLKKAKIKESNEQDQERIKKQA